MKVTIDINEDHTRVFDVLNNWASISRTLNSARECLESAAAGDAPNPDDLQRVIDELGDIEPAMDWLHSTVRGQIWEVLRQRR